MASAPPRLIFPAAAARDLDSRGNRQLRTTRNCVADGFRVHGTDDLQAFVVSETSGRWDKAIEVPGTGAADAGRDASVHRCRAPRRATAPPARDTGTAPPTTRAS